MLSAALFSSGPTGSDALDYVPLDDVIAIFNECQRAKNPRASGMSAELLHNSTAPGFTSGKVGAEESARSHGVNVSHGRPGGSWSHWVGEGKSIFTQEVKVEGGEKTMCGITAWGGGGGGPLAQAAAGQGEGEVGGSVSSPSGDSLDSLGDSLQSASTADQMPEEDDFDELHGCLDAFNSCFMPVGAGGIKAEDEAPASRPHSEFRCINPAHGQAGCCSECLPPPAEDEEHIYELVGDPGLKNGEKKLRRFILLSGEWNSAAERGRVADSVAGDPSMERFATTLRNKAVPRLRKADLFRLAREWRFSSDIWQPKANRRQRDAGVEEAAAAGGEPVESLLGAFDGAEEALRGEGEGEGGGRKRRRTLPSKLRGGAYESPARRPRGRANSPLSPYSEGSLTSQDSTCTLGDFANMF